MFITAVTFLAFFLAFLLRRPLHLLLERQFAGMGILLAGVALHFIVVLPAFETLCSVVPVAGMPALGGMLYTASLAFLAAFAWLNRKHLGIAVIGAGLLMNCAVIGANGGQMPVDATHLAAKGELDGMLGAEAAGLWSSYSVMTQNTRLPWLGDVIVVPVPTQGPSALSLGDLLIAAGIALFFLVIPEAREPAATAPSD